jgi:hypothetical protein
MFTLIFECHGKGFVVSDEVCLTSADAQTSEMTDTVVFKNLLAILHRLRVGDAI